MKRIVSIILLVLVLGKICAAQGIPMTIIDEIIHYGDSCYAFNDPEGMLYSNGYTGDVHQYGSILFKHTPSIDTTPHYLDDTVRLIHKYPECKELYGVAMNFGLFDRFSHTGNLDTCHVRRALKYVDIYAVLYVMHEDGTLEKIDETRWDTTTPYKFFCYQPPLSNFFDSVYTCELYFNRHHIIDSADTAWVGLEVRKNKKLDTCSIDFQLELGVYVAKWRKSGYWKIYCQSSGWVVPYSLGDHNSDKNWGGFFPITCPQNSPAEDTIENRIAKVRTLREEVTVYPNPAREWVEVRSGGSEVLGVTVYDMRGQIALKEHSKSTQSRVDIRALPAGVYMMKVETERGSAIKKVVKR